MGLIFPFVTPGLEVNAGSQGHCVPAPGQGVSKIMSVLEGRQLPTRLYYKDFSQFYSELIQTN